MKSQRGGTALCDHVRKTGLQSEWSVCPHREACSIWSKQCQEVCHSSFCVLGCATTLQPEVSGAKQTKGFSSHLRGTIRVGNPLGAETDSRAGQSQEERGRRQEVVSVPCRYGYAPRLAWCYCTCQPLNLWPAARTTPHLRRGSAPKISPLYFASQTGHNWCPKNMPAHLFFFFPFECCLKVMDDIKKEEKQNMQRWIKRGEMGWEGHKPHHRHWGGLAVPRRMVPPVTIHISWEQHSERTHTHTLVSTRFNLYRQKRNIHLFTRFLLELF